MINRGSLSDITFPPVCPTGSQTLHLDIPTSLTNVATMTMIPPKSDNVGISNCRKI